MQLDKLELHIDRHAYERYCERVEEITREDLKTLVMQQLHQGYVRRKGYIQFGGVWWRCSKRDDVFTLHTCYGRHHIDLPSAIKWAKRHKDRIALGDKFAE